MTEWINGLFLVLGFFTASFLVWRQARQLGLPEEKIIDLILTTTFFGLVGGRLFYVAGQADFFAANYVRILLFVKYPGFSLIGCCFVGTVSLAILSARARLAWLETLDLFILPALAAGFIGLTGCLSTTCPGIVPNRLPLAVVIFALVLVALSLLRRSILNDPRWSKWKSASGLVFLIGVVLVQLLGLSLAKNPQSSLYFLERIDLLVLGGAVLIWYRDIFKMLRIPSSVLKQVKDYLEGKLRDSESRLAQLHREDPATDKDRLHMEASDDDTANVKAKHEQVQALQFQLTKTVVEIRKALSKIKVGSYGTCEVCGKMIDTDRLAAKPSATLCLEDEKKMEKGKKR